MATPNYDIDYGDERFTQVEEDKEAALTENEQTYDGMIGEADKYYQDQIDAAKDYGEQQKESQQEQTDFAIEQIEQQKAQAKKDYIKEQSGAYTDWQKESTKHGVSAERMAAAGLSGSGYHETSLVSMYNAYQTRVATARESYNLAVLNYDNAIKDARLQNNALLAEIAYNTLQTQLNLSLQGFQYKNQLLLEKANTKREIENTYYSRYQDVITQINNENALAEEVRQYNEDMAYKNATLAEEKRQFDESLKLKKTDTSDNGNTYTTKKDTTDTEDGATDTEDDATDTGQTNTYTTTSKTTTNSNSITKDQNVQRRIDTQSVIKLGIGLLSESELNSLVEAGYLKEVPAGGLIKYEWTTKGAAEAPELIFRLAQTGGASAVKETLKNALTGG